MKRIILSLLVVFIAGCAGGGTPVVSTGPDGIKTFSGGKEVRTLAWDEVRGCRMSSQLNAKNNKSYPVLFVSTENSSNICVASSYSEMVDSKAYAGMYVRQSIAKGELEELRQVIIESAGLVESSKAEGIFVAPKERTVNPPPESRSFYKRIGS